MECCRSVSTVRRLAVALASIVVLGTLPSCGRAGGSKNSGSSGKPTELPGGGVRTALLLDIEELIPARDVVVTQGESVRFALRLGPEHTLDEVGVRWTLDSNERVGEGEELQLSTKNVALGTHVVRAEVTQQDASGSVSWRIDVVARGEVENRAPVILQALPPAGTSVRRGVPLTLSIVAVDPDAQDVLHYLWSLDGESVAGDSAAMEFDTSSIALGRHTMSVEVWDGVARADAARCAFSWSVDVAPESAHPQPYIINAWPQGSVRIGLEDRLRFEVAVEVPEREDSVKFRWEVDGIPQAFEGDAFHLEPEDLEGGQAEGPHRITCRPVSGWEEDGESLAAVGWTVERGEIAPQPRATGETAANAPPLFEEVFPQRATVAPGESKVFHAAAVDLDGDVLTYRWFVDGELQPVDGPVFAYTGTPDRNGGVRIDVEVSDGRPHEGSARSGSWEVATTHLAGRALTLASGALVIDNGQSGTSANGGWTFSNAAGAYGSGSVYSKVVDDTYTYSFTVNNSGKYEVLLWWTAWSSRATSVPVTIQHAQGTITVNVNQTLNGGKWNSLGVFDFSVNAKVIIRSVGGVYSTCADAACLNPTTASGGADGGDPGGELVAGEFVIDDGASGTSSVGTWAPSTAPNPYKSRSLYARDTGSYTFQRSLSSSGTYDVYAWWTHWQSRDSATPYEIVHSGGTAKVSKDQRTNGGKWNLLGRYSFSGSVKVTVRVRSSATVCADAVRFVPAGTAPPPPDDDPPSTGDITVDTGAPGTSSDGLWSPSTAPNSFGSASLYARDRGSYIYSVTLPASGTYGVYAWYTEWASRESSVPYEISHSSGTSVVRIDQRTGGGQWTPLGDYTFGASAKVVIRVVDGDTVCADAIRLSPGGGSTPPEEPPPPPPSSSVTPQITELSAFALTPHLARITWRTNFYGSSMVKFGLTTSVSDGTRSVTGSRLEHSVLIEPLSPDKVYYFRASSAGTSASANSAVVSFRMPTSTPSFAVSASHPRVFLNSADISSIRTRIQSSPMSGWWSSLVSFCNQQVGKSTSEINSGFSRTVAALAFAGLIGDVPAFRDKAIACSLAIAALSNTGDNKILRDRIDFVLPSYDWLHGYLSAAQRTTLRSKLAIYASSLESQVKDNEYADGHSNGNENGAFLAALAIYGEDSNASGIIQRGLTRYHEGFWPFWRLHCSENGGSFKSGWYTTVATQFNYEIFAAWKSATGKNLFQTEGVWFEKLADWYIHSLRGDMSWNRHGDVVLQRGVDEVERHLLTLIAREYKNSDAQWMARKILDFLGVYGPDMVFDLLWYDPSVPIKEPSQSTSRRFKGTGMVMTRESWKDDSVKAYFRAVPYYMGGHNHLDQNSFGIFYKEGLALDSGIYDEFGSRHHLNYYSRTIAHNAMLVIDPAEVFKLYGITEAPDGGQYWLDSSRVPNPFPEKVTDLTHDDAFQIGGVKAYRDDSLFTYALGDSTRAYNPNKVATAWRHFLWLKSLSGWSHALIMIFDEVEATKSTFRKVYLLHTQEKPSISGSLVGAASGSGMLYQRTVFPQSPAITLVGGPGKEYWVKDANYPPNRALKPGEEPGAWRVEVSPTTARVHDEFLHVLYPTTKGSSAPPTPRAIDALSMKGLETQGVVVLFSVKVESMPSVSYSLTGSRRNLLFGLSPERSHAVYLDGVLQAKLQSSGAGSLDFTNKAAGKVSVVRQ